MVTKKKEVEKTYKAIAKQFIKYGGNHLAPGQEFEVKESAIEELKQFADITIPEDKPDVNPNANNSDESEGDGEGVE